jgi:tetratricopeptide (TPR) repeat protein
MLKALDIYRKILPPDHEDLAELYEDTGWIYSSLGEEEKYLEYRLKAQNIREKIT